MLEAPELGAPVGLFGAPMGPQKVFAPPAENRTDAYVDIFESTKVDFPFIGVGAVFDWGVDGFWGAHRGPNLADWGP